MKILIVDDNRDSRMILKKMLESRGYRTEEAGNGRDALQRARSSKPDMIISDVLMPGMDGFKLCYEIKKDKELRKIPFVFYSATYVSPHDEKLAISLGASKYIVKPVEVDEFLSIIDGVIRDYKEEKLPIPRMPIEEEPELSKMYRESISRKLDEKIQELNLYREIFTNANDAIAVYDGDGKFVMQNASHRALLGHSDDEVINLSMPDLIGEENYYNLMENITKRGVFRGEMKIKSSSGAEFIIDVSAFPITDERGKIINYIFIGRDITAKKRAEEELRDRIKELEFFYDSAVSRELKMKELKEELKALKAELNRLKKKS